MYSNTTMNHFQDPSNVGEIENADAIGHAGNPSNGNFMKIWLRINDENTITGITFKTVGCVPAIASGSVITTLAKGKTLQDAAKITMGSIISELRGLPAEKRHTAKLALDALKNAIEQIGKK